MSPLKIKKLNKIRTELDKLDNSLIKIIKKRTNLVNQVLKLKEKKKEIIDNKKTIYEDNLGLAQKLNEKKPDKIWPKKDKDVNFIIKKSVLSGATANIKVSSISDPVKINLSEMMFSNFGNERGYQHYKDILKIILFDLYASMENERIKETLKQVYNF